MDLFSFRVEREDDLPELETRLENAGCDVERVSRGEAVGQGESIQFEIPSGQTMELVWDLEKLGNILGKHNPSPVPPPDLPGIAPPRIDHLLINAEEVGEAHSFFKEVLGFRMTEQVLDANGHQLGVWMERSHSPHDVAIVNGPNGALHHFAFWLDDWDHVRKSADILAYNGVQIDQGPTRHGVTRGNTSTSSTRSGRATRCSPAATARTRTSRRSPGPRTSSAAGSSTTRTSWRSASCASTPERQTVPRCERTEPRVPGTPKDAVARPHPPPAARPDPGPGPRALQRASSPS